MLGLGWLCLLTVKVLGLLSVVVVPKETYTQQQHDYQKYIIDSHVVELLREISALGGKGRPIPP